MATEGECETFEVEGNGDISSFVREVLAGHYYAGALE